VESFEGIQEQVYMGEGILMVGIYCLMLGAISFAVLIVSLAIKYDIDYVVFDQFEEWEMMHD
jgi:hypothetical protein